MTPLEQASLPVVRVMDPAAGPNARHALTLLDHAVDAYDGDFVSMRVSTMTQNDDVRSSICLTMTFEDVCGHKIHASVVVDESLYIAQVPLPRTSRHQAVWVRDTLRGVLDAPEGDPHPRRDEAECMLDAFAIIDRDDVEQAGYMEIQHMAATPLGTGGTHLCLIDERRSASDLASAVPGAIEIVVTRREHDSGGGSTTVIRLEAQSQTTPVPIADAVERLRLMRDIEAGRAVAA